jgi:hypothetical protein
MFSGAYDNFLTNGKEYPPFELGNREHKVFDFDKDESLVRYISKLPQQERENLQITDDGRVQIIKPLENQQPSSNTQKFLNLTTREAA